MSIAVVIPWRPSGDRDRNAAYTYTVGYYQRLYDAGVIAELFVSGDSATQGPFNRHRAYNLGARSATADVILWNEADTLIPAAQITAAADLAAAAPGLVVPYTARHELDAGQSSLVYGGHDPFGIDGAIVYADGRSIGQAGVTSRATLDAIGGRWDERFAGWGYDDNAMFHIFGTLAGPPRWVDGRGVHLWHTPAFHVMSEERQAHTDANAARFGYLRGLSRDELRDYMEAA